MKYLKSFMENKDEYYTIIDDPSLEREYNIPRDCINISNISINYIKNLFPNIVDGNIYKSNNDNFYRPDYVFKANTSGNTVTKYMDIHKYGAKMSFFELPDEYYIVGAYDKNYYYNKYKCDQLDGVKELLTDLGKI